MNCRRTLSAVSLITLLLLSFLTFPLHACLEVMVYDEENNLAGNNEDYWNFNTKIWYYPASESEYGRVCVGYDEIYGFVQGGMNDQGLFIDGNALDQIDSWKPDPSKPDYPDSLEVCGEILAHCANVEEAIEVFRKYNHSSLMWARFPLADALGNSVVVEWGRGELQVVRRTGKYQIATNFVQSDFDKMADYPCERYFIADKIMTSVKEYNLDSVRRVLAATHQEGYVNTLYSNICDLKNKKMYLYYFHNFEEPVVIDLGEELQKGKHGSDLPALFEIRPYCEADIKASLPVQGSTYLEKYLEEKGIDSTLVKYEALKDDYLIKRRRVDISEEEINMLGYNLMNKNKMKEALAIFTLNVKDHPGSWNVYDSLGEVYLKNGQLDLAKQNYEKSVEMNPGNLGGKEALRRLSNKK